MASLPEDPRDAALEDFVAAHFVSRGAYVETGITERHPIDILELDVVWTNYSNDPPTANPVEIKGGKDLHLGDVFKFFGWTQYLKLPPGQFVHREPFTREDADTLAHIAAATGVRIVRATTLPEDLDQHLDAIGLPKPHSAKVHDLWRFSFWTQRELLKQLRDARKKDGSIRQTVVKAVEYQRLINDAVFFRSDIGTRVMELLQAHFSHQRLAASVALELEAGQVEYDSPRETTTFRDALYNGKHLPVQAALYLSHRARLYILKAAVDYWLGLKSGAIKDWVIQIGGKTITLDRAPYSSFRKAIDELSQLSSFKNLPVFWQTFLWSWGGFVLLDRAKDEYALLEKETGVRADEIPTALTAFDKLFPVKGGWMRQPGNDQRMLLMQMPAVMRGLGAFRRRHFVDAKDYSDLGYKDNTGWRLNDDHNALASLLNS